MDTEMILGVVIAGPVVLSITALLCASEDWLRRFGELARCLERPL